MSCRWRAWPGESWIASGAASTSVRTAADMSSMPVRNGASLTKPWSTATSKHRPSAANSRLSRGSMTASLSGSCRFVGGGGQMVKRCVLILVVAIAASAAPARAASPGADGVGDSLFPQLGNGGYDVKHYDLDLRYAT